MTKKLIIRSIDNEDWNGTFFKGEVEQEMRELDNVPENDNDWLYWVVGHMFDCRDFTGELETAICGCDAIRELELLLDDGAVTIKKI